jgi:hypothetical protein
MTYLEDDMVIFHKLPRAKAVLQQAGTMSVHDVYCLPTDSTRKYWGLYARKGSGYIRLHASKATGKSRVTVHSFHLPFAVTTSGMGYLSIPEGWRWPK